MKAIIQDRYGPAEVLYLADIGRPEPADNQVLIKVHAAGVDRGTWHLTEGKPYLMRVSGYGLRKPSVRAPGLDVAGTVVKIGSNVRQFAVGDEVFGTCGGSFAEYALAKESSLLRKPDRLSFEAAAAVPTSAVTAWKGLHDAGGVVQGQRVLIIGASGGVGSFAVQVAKAAGAEVTAVCGLHGVDLVRSLGADFTVDYHRDEISTAHNFDLIVDIGGGRTLSRLRQALASQGTLVLVGSEKADGGLARWVGCWPHPFSRPF